MRKHFKNEKGQGTVEYLLIIGVMVVAIFALKDPISRGLKTLTDNVFGKTNKKIDQLMQ